MPDLYTREAFPSSGSRMDAIGLTTYPLPTRGNPEGLAPVSDGLVRDRNAPLSEKVFDVAEAEGEPVVEPDSVADNRGREPVAWIAVTSSGIQVLCARSPQVDNAAYMPWC